MMRAVRERLKMMPMINERLEIVGGDANNKRKMSRDKARGEGRGRS